MKALITNKTFSLSLIIFAILCLLREQSWVDTLDLLIFGEAILLSVSITWLKFWYFITNIGSGGFVYILAGFLAISYLWKEKSFLAFIIIALTIVLFLAPPLFKLIYHLPRPVCLAPFYPELASYTFPSGHAFNGVVLFYFIPRLYHLAFYEDENYSQLMTFCLSPWIAAPGITLIALSRVFLGMHWFSDIIGGVLLGLTICSFSIFLMRKAR
ncbi:MAG: phosphatase PAP2 family protein [bacterium]|nr:phosphatase PAP2 family protein [bacterium]MBU1918242.1 phosphatase PAP2 family protein [bacterium]